MEGFAVDERYSYTGGQPPRDIQLGYVFLSRFSIATGGCPWPEE